MHAVLTWLSLESKVEIMDSVWSVSGIIRYGSVLQPSLLWDASKVSRCGFSA